MLSKSQAKVFFIGGTLLFGGIFLALTVDSMRQIPSRTHEDKLTPQVIRGKKIWEKNNCMGCHTLFGEGAYYAPELTKVFDRRGEAWLRVFLKDPEAMFPGQRKMVNYHFNDAQIADVISFLKWCGEVDLNGFPAKPPLRDLMVRPVAASTAMPVSSKPQPQVFKTICMACHSLGGQGGIVGPALDLAYTRKTREQMVVWITDPGKVKPGTLMPKLPLTPEQIDSLADYLSSFGGAQ